jgi:23S rRNA pseudouridine1911/1915/1917 synthase
MTTGEADDEPEAGVEVRHFAVSVDGHGHRLDKLLVTHAAEFSRSHLQGLIERGCVQVDGVVAGTASHRLRAGQEVRVELQPTDESRAFTPEPMALAIRFEDEHLLVLAKPAGLVVHPAPGHWRGTLLNGLLAHYRGASQLPRAGIVHRLDKDTSGLMVVAKTLPAMTALVRAMAAREVKREYLALVHGEVPATPFSIEAAIGRDPVTRVRMAVVSTGKPARTDVARLACRDHVSAVRCTLHSGRTHQIRVHLAWRGHPLLADALYGGAPALGLLRQALHATRLGLRHPITARVLAFDEPLPADLQPAWSAICG